MANKRSEGGSRGRDLFRSEVSSFLADLGDLTQDLGPGPDRGRASAAESPAPAEGGEPPAPAAAREIQEQIPAPEPAAETPTQPKAEGGEPAERPEPTEAEEVPEPAEAEEVPEPATAEVGPEPGEAEEGPEPAQPDVETAAATAADGSATTMAPDQESSAWETVTWPTAPVPMPVKGTAAEWATDDEAEFLPASPWDDASWAWNGRGEPTEAPGAVEREAAGGMEQGPTGGVEQEVSGEGGEEPSEVPPPPSLPARAEAAEATPEASSSGGLLERIEDLPSFNPSYLPPLPPPVDGGTPESASFQRSEESEAPLESTRAAAPSGDDWTAEWVAATTELAGSPTSAEPQEAPAMPAGAPSETSGPQLRLLSTDEPTAPAEPLTGEPAQGLQSNPTRHELEPLPAAPDLQAGQRPGPPILPGRVPTPVSSRPWTLAAAMEPVQSPTLSTPRTNPTAAAEAPGPELLAPIRRRTRPRIRLQIPVLPTVLVLLLVVIVALLVLRLLHR